MLKNIKTIEGDSHTPKCVKACENPTYNVTFQHDKSFGNYQFYI